jgi:glycosyltransferase involved in cell wall biosynthesis
VVSTDCPGGAREILADGRYGPLVRPGSHRELADAMAAVLAAPPPPELLRSAAERYTLEAAVDAYLPALGLEPRP